MDQPEGIEKSVKHRLCQLRSLKSIVCFVNTGNFSTYVYVILLESDSVSTVETSSKKKPLHETTSVSVPVDLFSLCLSFTSSL